MRLLVVDGLDGCGKDTHADRMKKLLVSRGEKVTLVSHPSKRFFGRMSKRFLRGSGPVARFFASMFYTADVLRSVSWLKGEHDGTVIFVRYLMGTAYLPRRLAPTGYRLFRRLLPFPDLAMFIDIDPKVAIRRITARGYAHEMFETLDKLESIRNIAKQLVSSEWITIDNSEDGEEPFREVESILISKLGLGPAV
jgi:dTMP kinase